MKNRILTAALLAATPALADEDAAFKAQMDKLTQTFVEAFNAKNLAALDGFYAPDGVYVDPTGQVFRGDERRKNTEALFAAGFHEAALLKEAHRFGDAAFVIGSFTLSIPGKPVKIEANWTGVYAIDGDKVRIKLLTASIPPASKP